MSSILDALRKLEAEKANSNGVPIASGPSLPPPDDDHSSEDDIDETPKRGGRQPHTGIHLTPGMLIGGAVVLAVVTGVVSLLIAGFLTDKESAPKPAEIVTQQSVQSPTPPPVPAQPIPNPVPPVAQPQPPAPQPQQVVAQTPVPAPEPTPPVAPPQPATVPTTPPAPVPAPQQVPQPTPVTPVVTSVPLPTPQQVASQVPAEPTPPPAPPAQVVVEEAPKPKPKLKEKPIKSPEQLVKPVEPQPVETPQTPQSENVTPEKPAILTTRELRALPALSETEKGKLGLTGLRINMVRPANANRPYGSAILNLTPVVVGEVIPNSKAKLIAVEPSGIGIESTETGTRFYIRF